MARIRILPLPTRVVGELVEEPFALIIDQAEGLGDVTEIQANLQGFKADCGAAGLLVVGGVLDIPTDEPPAATVDPEMVAAKIRNALGIPAPALTVALSGAGTGSAQSIRDRRRTNPDNSADIVEHAS